MFSYVVKKSGDFHKDGVLLRRGDALTGEDARWLESPENHHLLLRCNRVQAHRIDESSPYVISTSKAEG